MVFKVSQITPLPFLDKQMDYWGQFKLLFIPKSKGTIGNPK
jgi:hypothetical protein